ncbi:hypothetical protein DYB32_001834 [Aphanomyces invadans]|uniref:Fe2OG dioxygenase domain-containing protein n=1 Tax=Aphanomyces invadans TaxID=157072 RepID=A0A418B9G4_9STRA|nr:hypothetical protein DYB32_001834 [Aphanomyces invadans]
MVSVLLECQAPYTDWILRGRKTIETRRYPFPSHLLHKPIWLLESPSGVVGSSSLPSVVDLSATPRVRVVGRIVVSASYEYTSRAQWDADAENHCVPPDSGYAWTEGTGQYFGWTVASASALSHAPTNLTHILRSYRSFFVPVIPVPTVDLSEPFRPDVLAAVEAQCASLGFLRVSWSSFPKDVVRNAHDAMRRFFDCDLSVKEAVTLPLSATTFKGTPRPYKPTGYRGVRTMHNGEGRETWSCTRPDYDPGHPDFADPYYTTSGCHVFATPPIPQVLWPDEEQVPGFRAALTAYYAAMDALGKVLFRVFARILQLPHDEALVNLARRHTSSMNASRLHPSEDKQGGGVVLMPHADITCFTILSHDAEGAGAACLEVLHPLANRPTGDDEARVVWVGIAPDNSSKGDEAFLVNVGQILERWSNGRLKATLHRVVKPVHPSTVATKRRQALVYFQVADYDAVLTPMVERTDDNPSRWKPERMDAFTSTRFGPIADKTLDTVDAYAVYNQDVMARDAFVRLARES